MTQIIEFYIHSVLWGHTQIGPFPYKRDYIPNICRISIPVIRNVIWGQTNLFPIPDRSPNTLSPKDRLSKNWIFTHFEPLTEAAVIAYKVLSKEVCPQVKILTKFFSQTRSQRVLVGFQWLLYEKASILIDLKGCKISFLISPNWTHLWYPECSKCISSQNP